MRSSGLSKYNSIQVIVHLAFWTLAAWLTWDYFSGNLTVNPIQAAQQRTGRYAIYLLVLSLACTPLNTIFGFRQALTARRTLGLYAFAFALVHFFLFIAVDYGFDLGLILTDVGTKRYILAGAFTLLLLSPLAFTSFRYWMRRLGKRWKLIHRLVYLAGISAVLHFAWARKGDLAALQGDVLAPALLGLVVLVLLFVRLPGVRKKIVSLRHKLTRHPISFQFTLPWAKKARQD
jgi:sulfoxide reductase heme-binding subunit YedZ